MKAALLHTMGISSISWAGNFRLRWNREEPRPTANSARWHTKNLHNIVARNSKEIIIR